MILRAAKPTPIKSPAFRQPAPDAALLARVKPFLNEGKYGNFYSPSSPYLYAPN